MVGREEFFVQLHLAMTGKKEFRGLLHSVCCRCGLERYNSAPIEGVITAHEKATEKA